MAADNMPEPVMAEGSYDWWALKVERLQADVQAALAERDQQFERKAEALRERDEARRELAVAVQRAGQAHADAERKIADVMDRTEAEVEQLQAERDEARLMVARYRTVWGEWRDRLGGSFPRAMVQEIDAALNAPVTAV